jgi:proline iminopeptidase
VAAFGEERHALGLSHIEAHYFKHGVFLEDGQLLKGVERIRKIPATIIQGRYDIVCPIQTAEALHQAWPEADYHVVPDAGHSAMEPGIRRALVAAPFHDGGQRDATIRRCHWRGGGQGGSKGTADL